MTSNIRPSARWAEIQAALGEAKGDQADDLEVVETRTEYGVHRTFEVTVLPKAGRWEVRGYRPDYVGASASKRGRSRAESRSAPAPEPSEKARYQERFGRLDRLRRGRRAVLAAVAESSTPNLIL